MYCSRLRELDISKGLAILLVVSGHLLSRCYENSVPWYFTYRSIIYQFHIAFFFFLAGITFALVLNKAGGTYNYLLFIRKRAFRFIPSYIVLSIAIYLGKLFAQNLNLLVENPIINYWDLLSAFYYPNASAIEYLWFIYVLLLYYITVPLFISISNNRHIFLILITVLISLIPGTGLFAFNNYQFYLFYFIVGYIIYYNYGFYINIINKYGFLFILLFILILMTVCVLKIPKVAVGFFCIPGLYALSRLILLSNKHVILEYIGKHTFTIYLFHEIFIGLSKVFLLKIIPLNKTSFVLYFIILIPVSVFIPIYLKEKIFKRYRLLNKYF